MLAVSVVGRLNERRQDLTTIEIVKRKYLMKSFLFCVTQEREAACGAPSEAAALTWCKVRASCGASPPTRAKFKVKEVKARCRTVSV